MMDAQKRLTFTAFMLLFLAACGTVEPSAIPTQEPVPTATATLNLPAETPSASPLEGRIAFISDRDGHPQLYHMNANGSDQQRLLTSKDDDYYPSWSPDGTELAFYRHFSWQYWAIMAVNADGSDLRQLTDNTNGLTCSFGPVWSPDGTQIAFTVEPDPQPTCEMKHTEIAVMDADGGNVRFLTQNDSNDLAAGWSPDGNRVIFVSDRDGSNQVYVMGADGGNPQRLTDLGSVNSMPAISPDGQSIVFVSNREGNDEIYIMNADGSNPTRLTNDPASDWQPSWSPDGKQIVFISGSPSGGFDIFVMGDDGTNLRQLTDNPGWEFEPVWQP
jgi:Tol biopolymer transport system component